MLVTYEEEKNRRQVPKVKEYLAMKEYCDYLYCYLQVISKYDEANNERFILAKDCKYTSIGNALGMSRQTASKKFNALIDAGLLIKDGEKYILVNLETHGTHSGERRNRLQHPHFPANL